MSGFQWTARVVGAAKGRAVVYARRHRWEVGLPLTFDPHYDGVTALEYALGAVGAELINGLEAVARRKGIPLEQREAVVSTRLQNPLVHLGVVGETGDPGLERISLKVYLSSPADQQTISQLWATVLARCPLIHTWQRCLPLELSWERVP